MLLLLSSSIQAVNAQWHQRELTVTQTHYFEPSFFIPHSIHFSDINNGYITGDGVILKYNGKEWLPVPIGEGFTPYLDAVYTIDSSHTFFAGNGGAFYKYDGQNLKKINTGTTNELLSISMINSTEGWVSGVGGTILHIKGDSVTDYSIYPPFEMRHIYFDKPDHGWALCTRSFWNQGIQYNYVTLYEFKNNTWAEYYLTLGGIATGIDFTPPGEGYISTTENLYHYNKSYQSWEPVFPQKLTNPIRSVSMLNDNTGICMQDNNSYLIYKYGKWSAHQSFLQNMVGAEYVDAGTVWAISSNIGDASYGDWKNHLIYQLKDTGWSEFSLKYLDTLRTDIWKGTFESVAPFGKKHVRLNGFLINLPDTSDWADTIKTLDPPLDSFLSVKSYNETIAWGQDGENLISAKGNQFSYHPVFNFDSSISSYWISDINFFQDTSAWAIGLKYPVNQDANDIPYLVYYNNEKKSISSEYNPGTTKTPYHVHFSDKNNGWCVGDSGLILKYANNNWQMMNSPTDNFLAAVFTIDATNAWAGGENGTLLKYDGNSWKKVNINTTKGIIDIYFTDKDHGWLVGEGGLMYKYDGTSWSKDTAITTNDLYDIYMVNSNYGWAVGDSGTILQYINNDTAVTPRIANADIPSTIFPNPSSENILIQFELKKSGNTVISLFNQQGKKVDTYKLGILQAGKFSKNINISALQDGTYFYEIISSGVRSIGKFIKVH